MQLTTPEIIDYDPVFPAPNWFFYWKTSPSLWESKLRAANFQGPVLIPVYWGLHAQNPEQFDFGQYNPETDLFRLVELCQSLNLNPALIIPTTPMPFLPNGGVPAHLANYLARDENSMAMGILDGGGRVNKIYSYFSPQLFTPYRHFVFSMAEQFRHQSVSCEVYGVNFGYLDSKGNFTSYGLDSSNCFERGLARYISQLRKVDQEKIDQQMQSPQEVAKIKEEYSLSVMGLYEELVKEAFRELWVKKISVGLLGGNTLDAFHRSFKKLRNPVYMQETFSMLAQGVIPASVLLADKEQPKLLKDFFARMMGATFIAHKLESYSSEHYDYELHPLVFFNFLTLYGDLKSYHARYLESGLINYIQQRAPWCYHFSDLSPGEDGEDSFPEQTYILSQKVSDRSLLRQVWQLLLSGNKLIVDLPRDQKDIHQQIDLFVAENQLKHEEINFMVKTSRLTLGEGQILFYDGDELEKIGKAKQNKFWQSLLNTLKINHAKIEADDGVVYNWSTRSSTTNELNYQEVRRVNIYNPTSYKRKVQLQTNSQTALIRSIDQVHAHIDSTPIGVSAQLLPGGHVAFDLGVFE